MKPKLMILVVVLFIMLISVLSACSYREEFKELVGNGKEFTLTTSLKEDAYQVHITNIYFKKEPHNSIVIDETKANTVSITTAENLGDTIKVTVNEAKKTIKISGDKKIRYIDAKLAIVIGVPVNDITIDGGYTIDINPGSVTSFNMLLNGACEGKLKTASLSDFILTVNGASNLTLEGNCKDSKITLNGAAAIHALKLLTRNSDITLNGASTCKVYATELLDAKINGVGKIIYNGNPKTVNQKVSGLGSIIKGSDKDELLDTFADDAEPKDE